MNGLAAPSCIAGFPGRVPAHRATRDLATVVTIERLLPLDLCVATYSATARPSASARTHAVRKRISSKTRASFNFLDGIREAGKRPSPRSQFRCGRERSVLPKHCRQQKCRGNGHDGFTRDVPV
jgi:hypothetical protein